MKKAAGVLLCLLIPVFLLASDSGEKMFKDVQFGMTMKEISDITGALSPEGKLKKACLVKNDIMYGLPCEVQFYFTEDGRLRTISLRFDSIKAEAVYDELKKSFEKKYGTPVNKDDEGDFKTYMYLSGKMIAGLAFVKEAKATHLSVEYTRY